MGKASPYRATRYSVLALRPASPDRDYTQWLHWKVWAKQMVIVDKHGNPSLSKVKMLIKHKCLSAKLTNCLPTFHSNHPYTGKKIFRRILAIVVTPRRSDQIKWKAEDWQSQYRFLFSRSQSWKAKHKRKRK